jgi:Fur family peroxide stress response transcriptional regulator
MQREKILEILQGTTSHPSADWLYGRLKNRFPRLSMGTVYRNLNILLDQGLIRKIDFGSTFDRVDANRIQHYHFICEKCGLIKDLEIPVDPSMDEKVMRSTSCTVNRHRLEFFGTCDLCKS